MYMENCRVTTEKKLKRKHTSYTNRGDKTESYKMLSQNQRRSKKRERRKETNNKSNEKKKSQTW